MIELLFIHLFLALVGVFVRGEFQETVFLVFHEEDFIDISETGKQVQDLVYIFK